MTVGRFDPMTYTHMNAATCEEDLRHKSEGRSANKKQDRREDFVDIAAVVAR